MIQIINKRRRESLTLRLLFVMPPTATSKKIQPLHDCLFQPYNLSADFIIYICGGTVTEITVPPNTVQVPITTGTVTDSGSECTGFIG